VLGSSIAAGLLIASAAAAGERTVRLFGVAGDTTGTETRISRGEVGLRVQGGSVTGIGVGLELALKPRIGLDFDLLTGSAGYQARMIATPRALALTNDPAFQVLSVGAHFDLASEGRLRLFAGPRLGVLRREGFHLAIESDGSVRESEVSTSDLALGLIVGADIRLGSGRWALHSSLRYLAASGDDSFLQIEPLMATFGVARRF